VKYRKEDKHNAILFIKLKLKKFFISKVKRYVKY
jgi:hypothetical protein